MNMDYWFYKYSKLFIMNSIKILGWLVRDFYESHRDSWIPYWTEYLYEHHIFFVADMARDLSVEFWVDPEFAVAASLLHDIADAIVDRTHPDHMKISEMTALDLLEKAWFWKEEIDIIVYDIIAKHSCRNGTKPTSIEWQIMTTADAIYHLVSDFCEFAIAQNIRKWQSPETIRKWWLAKIERDFFIKISFDEVRERYRADYERCKKLFLSL